MPDADLSRYDPDSGINHYCMNALFDRDTIRARPLVQTFPSLPSAGTPRNLWLYRHRSSNPDTRLLALAHQTLYATESTEQLLNSAVALDPTLDAAGNYYATQHERFLYLVGPGPVRQWAGGPSISSIYPQSANATNSRPPTVKEDSVYLDADEKVIEIVITRAGSRDDVDGTTARFSWEVIGGSTHSNIDIEEETDLTGTGITLLWEKAEYFLGDTWRLRAQPITSVREIVDTASPSHVPIVTARPGIPVPVSDGGKVNGRGKQTPIPEALDGDWRIGYLDDIAGFNGNAQADYDNDFVTPQYVDLCVRKFVSHDTAQTDASVGLEILRSTNWGNIPVWCWMRRHLRQPLDLSKTDTLEIGLKFVTDQTAFATTQDRHPDLFIEFGTEHHDQHLKSIIAVPMTDVQPNVWCNVAVDLTQIPAEARANVTELALALWTGDNLDATDRIDVTPDTYGYGTTFTYAMTLLIDHISVQAAQPWFSAGEYQFLYTYATFDGLTWVESPPSQIITKSLADDMTGAFSVKVEADPGADLEPDVDRIYVYALGGPFSSWRRIGDHVVTDGRDTYETIWSGDVEELTTPYLPYVQAPPQDCSFAVTHRDRVFYTKGDKFYLSNTGDGTQVPQKAWYELYDYYGGSGAAGSDGGDVTALHHADGVTYLFKPRGIWAFTGDTNEDFRLDNLTYRYGCTAPKSVASLPGVMAVWMDSSGDVCVLHPGGREATPLGADENGAFPLRTIFSNFTQAERDAAIGVADTVNNRYVIHVPSAGALTGSATYVYDFKSGGWSQHNFQLFAALCDAPTALYPGVYGLVKADGGADLIFYERSKPASSVSNEAIDVIWESMADNRAIGAYASVDRVRLLLNTDSAVTIRITLKREEESPDIYLEATPDMKHILWSPPVQEWAGRAQLRLNWREDSTPTGLEILALDADVRSRGDAFG